MLQTWLMFLGCLFSFALSFIIENWSRLSLYFFFIFFLCYDWKTTLQHIRIEFFLSRVTFFFYCYKGKGKGCLAEIIGFASPLLQQHMLPPSFITFYIMVTLMFLVISMPSVDVGNKPVPIFEWTVAPAPVVFEPGAYRMRSGRSNYYAIANTETSSKYSFV